MTSILSDWNYIGSAILPACFPFTWSLPFPEPLSLRFRFGYVAQACDLKSIQAQNWPYCGVVKVGVWSWWSRNMIWWESVSKTVHLLPCTCMGSAILFNVSTRRRSRSQGGCSTCPHRQEVGWFCMQEHMWTGSHWMQHTMSQCSKMAFCGTSTRKECLWCGRLAFVGALLLAYYCLVANQHE